MQLTWMPHSKLFRFKWSKWHVKRNWIITCTTVIAWACSPRRWWHPACVARRAAASGRSMWQGARMPSLPSCSLWKQPRRTHSSSPRFCFVANPAAVDCGSRRTRAVDHKCRSLSRILEASWTPNYRSLPRGHSCRQSRAGRPRVLWSRLLGGAGPGDTSAPATPTLLKTTAHHVLPTD